MTSIGDSPQEHPDPSGPEADYSYDLVHDEVPAARRTGHVADRARAVSPAEPDAGGDYSYDLAHEVPSSRPR